MPILRNLPVIFLIAVTTILFIFGLFHQFFELKVYTVFAFLICAAIAVSVPQKWSLRVLFTYLGFEGFLKIISGYHPVVHVGVDLLVVALTSKVLIGLALGIIKKEEDLPPLTILFGIHFIWFLITFANPYSLGIVPSLAGAKVYITMLLLYFFAYYLAKKPKEIKVIMAIWVAVTTIHCIAGLYQFSMGPSSVLQIHPGYANILTKYGSYAFRPFGLTHLPGLPAIFIFLSISFLVYFSFSLKNWLFKIMLFSMAPFWILLSLLCQVRSALLKAIISVGFFISFYLFKNLKQMSARSFQRLVAIVALLVAFIFIVPNVIKEAESTLPDAARAFERSLTLFDIDKISSARKDTFDRFIAYAQIVPFGAGLSRTGAASGKFRHLIDSKEDPFGDLFFADNFWIATVIDLGIPGMIFLTLIIGLIIFRGFKYLSGLVPPENQMLYCAIFSGLLASAIGMYGAEAMLYNPEAAYFWFFAGVLTRLQQSSQELKAIQYNKESEREKLADFADSHF